MLALIAFRVGKVLLDDQDILDWGYVCIWKDVILLQLSVTRLICGPIISGDPWKDWSAWKSWWAWNSGECPVNPPCTLNILQYTGPRLQYTSPELRSHPWDTDLCFSVPNPMQPNLESPPFPLCWVENIVQLRFQARTIIYVCSWEGVKNTNHCIVKEF